MALSFTAEPERDFWQGSGFSLLTRDDAGHLCVTDDFLRAYWQRPEVAPVEESLAAERALHQDLIANPRRPLSDDDIAALGDADAEESYRIVRDFRDRLMAAGTVERCYLGLFEEEQLTLPPIFLDQMTHVILRNILSDVKDPFQLRAAELLFREQNVTREVGAVLLGDREVVDMLATTRGMGSLGKLVAEAGTTSRQVDMDVLQPENTELYWERDDRYDMVLDLTFTRPGLDALCRVLEAWVRHFLGTEVSIQPVQEISDEKWVWHVGLDVTSNQILNDLYNGVEVGEDRLQQLVSLFRLNFEDPSQMQANLRGRPVYLGLAMSAQSRLRLKAQNLLANLPLATEQ